MQFQDIEKYTAKMPPEKKETPVILPPSMFNLEPDEVRLAPQTMEVAWGSKEEKEALRVLNRKLICAHLGHCEENTNFPAAPPIPLKNAEQQKIREDMRVLLRTQNSKAVRTTLLSVDFAENVYLRFLREKQLKSRRALDNVRQELQRLSQELRGPAGLSSTTNVDWMQAEVDPVAYLRKNKVVLLPEVLEQYDRLRAQMHAVRLQANTDLQMQILDLDRVLRILKERQVKLLAALPLDLQLLLQRYYTAREA